MFHQIPLSGESVVALLDKDYTELSTCIYGSGEDEKNLVICINTKKKSFFITDDEGIKDTETLVLHKFEEKIIKTTLDKIEL